MPKDSKITGINGCSVHDGRLISGVTIQQSGDPCRASAFWDEIGMK